VKVAHFFGWLLAAGFWLLAIGFRPSAGKKLKVYKVESRNCFIIHEFFWLYRLLMSPDISFEIERDSSSSKEYFSLVM